MNVLDWLYGEERDVLLSDMGEGLVILSQTNGAGGVERVALGLSDLEEIVTDLRQRYGVSSWG